MKYPTLFSFILILVFSACTAIADIKLATPTQSEPLPTIDVGFVAPVLPTQEPQKDDTPMNQPTQSPTFSGLESLIENAKEDLAQRLSISTSQIDLVEAEEVVWPDSSLGCPQPGMKYRQVPEDGALIVLQAQGVEFEYHSGGGRGLFLCEKVFSSPEKPTQIDITKLTPPAPDNGIPPGEDQ